MPKKLQAPIINKKDAVVPIVPVVPVAPKTTRPVGPATASARVKQPKPLK